MAPKSRKKGAARAAFRLTSPDSRPHGPIAKVDSRSGFPVRPPPVEWDAAQACVAPLPLLR
jgi:hypothetical protein